MSYYDDVYQIVLQIPPGRVSTYGRIAAITPVPRGARGVGWALAGLSEAEARSIPWWRVVNASGRISNPFHGELQRALLEEEGIVFSEPGSIDLKQFLWEPEL
ncbi:MAG: MGMT family protein [Roseiflexaceae bacterium]|nr:MGMT family protein [Roseiflexaceae bacterium]